MSVMLVAGLLGVASNGYAQPFQPVEYVKICSMYGAAFHYIPGTDTCLNDITGAPVSRRWAEPGGRFCRTRRGSG